MADTDPVAAFLDECRDLAEVQGDVAALLAAVEVVLAAHRSVDGRCAWCREADGQRSQWPCGEFLTVSRALLGEGESGG
jgi:hypothetical protein